MKKMEFNTYEVIAFLEDKILLQEADDREYGLYIDYTYGNKLNKYTYRSIVEQMIKLSNEKY